MYELYPYFTNDGSVGLFSPEADDIYHSTYGALSEAYEKFIVPAELETFLQNKNEIKKSTVIKTVDFLLGRQPPHITHRLLSCVRRRPCAQ